MLLKFKFNLNVKAERELILASAGKLAYL